MIERKDILDNIVKSIKKEHSTTSIMSLEDRLKKQKGDVISTGCCAVDRALGGGIPRGRIVEIFGPESSGKTTLAISIIKQAQMKGASAAYIDVEHSFDPEYAKAIGVDESTFLVCQPDSGDEALNIAVRIASSSAIDIIVIDSVAALIPKSEIEGEVGDSFMGAQARMLAQAVRKLVPIINKNNCSVIFINQLREKIGVVFGSNEITPGGRSLKFAATIRAEIRRVTNIKKDNQDIGIRSRVKVVKNKVFPPFKIAECEIFFGSGISAESGIIETGANLNVLEKNGSWISFKSKNIAQGKENLRNLLIHNIELKEEILMDIKEKEKASSI